MLFNKKSAAELPTFSFINTIKEFEKILIDAQTYRKDRPNTMVLSHLRRPGQFIDVPEWHVYELNLMMLVINEKRKERKLLSVTLNDVRKAEEQALGHSNYTHKLALQCAELAMGF